MRDLVCAAVLWAAATLSCFGEEGRPVDDFHVGLSLGIVADFYNLPPSVYPTRGDLYVRYGAWESTLRCYFYVGSYLDVSLDARLAPRFGAYLPACGLGIRVFATYRYDGAGVFLSVVPCRFDLGPLIGALVHRRCPEVLLSTCEFRFGSVVPELFSPGDSFSYLFAAELTLLRVGIGI